MTIETSAFFGGSLHSLSYPDMIRVIGCFGVTRLTTVHLLTVRRREKNLIRRGKQFKLMLLVRRLPARGIGSVQFRAVIAPRQPLIFFL